METMDLGGIKEWVCKMRPRTIHDLKPLLILCQGLLRDAVEFAWSSQNRRLEELVDVWEQEKQMIVEEHMAVVKALQEEMQDLMHVNKETESQLRMGRVLQKTKVYASNMK
ncbi:unnamed protein product, partial [Ostreobium quekettii]